MGPKALEVTGGSILLSCLSIFISSSFFFFYSCSRQCLLIAMIIIAIHPHFTAFFIVSVKKKAVQELLRRKAVFLRTDIFFQTILRCLAWLRHRLIMRTSLLAGNNTEKFAYKRHDMNIL